MDDRTPPTLRTKVPPPAARDAAREARRAQALRVNLRRRKALSPTEPSSVTGEH